MSQTLLNRTTATKDNALTEAERDAFLTELRVGRLASNRGDGWSHLTPIWYVWEDGKFILSPRQEPPPPPKHRSGSARDAVRGRGPAHYRPDQVASGRGLLRAGKARRGRGGHPAGTQKVEDRYLPGAEGPELEELLWFEGRVVVEIEPVRWLAWDQGKG